MTNQFDMQLTKQLAAKYRKGSKKQKREIITTYCDITKVSRNTAVKRFARIRTLPDLAPFKTKYQKKHRKKGAPKKYLPLHYSILKRCWELSQYICAERLKENLSVCLSQLRDNYELCEYQQRDIDIVQDMSEITIKRAIGRFLEEEPQYKQNRRNKRTTDLLSSIPIKAHFGTYATMGAGYIEVDYVEHNGGSAKGHFAITGNYTDIGTQWIVRSAALGKSLLSITNIHDTVHGRIHHAIKEYHPDNAPTILSLLFYRMNQQIQNTGTSTYQVSRSRSYKKNDNAHVEQKNNNKVRKILGHHRFDTQEEVSLLNQLYEKMDLYDNFFIPSKKLKQKITDDKGKVKKKIYDKPKTPYQRILEDQTVDKETKQDLEQLYNSLNMVQLKKEIDELLARLNNIISQKNKT